MNDALASVHDPILRYWQKLLSPIFLRLSPLFFFFFFNDTATTEIYTLSLHDALPIYFQWCFAIAGGIRYALQIRLQSDGLRSCNSAILYSRHLYQHSILVDRCFPEWRSEEHTSELQSHSDIVCRLLLEKKKKYASPTSGTDPSTFGSRSITSSWSTPT